MSPAQQKACATNDFNSCLRQHCDCWHEEGQPDPSEFAAMQLVTVGKAFVKSVLPDTYEATGQRQPLAIRCVSAEGIRQNGDAEDDEQWGYTMAAFRQHFGEHLLEVSHSVNFCHTDFTIYLRA